jgi:hypothetical protein
MRIPCFLRYKSSPCGSNKKVDKYVFRLSAKRVILYLNTDRKSGIFSSLIFTEVATRWISNLHRNLCFITIALYDTNASLCSQPTRDPNYSYIRFLHSLRKERTQFDLFPIMQQHRVGNAISDLRAPTLDHLVLESIDRLLLIRAFTHLH